MRVLYITHVGAMDGANRSLLQLIEELRANHNVIPIVVCPREATRNGQSIASECKARGIECYVVPLVKFKLAVGKSFIERFKIFLSFIIFHFLNDKYIVFYTLVSQSSDFKMVY